MERTIEKEINSTKLTVKITQVGNDFNILLYGGKAHIGCSVLAIPRPSLQGNGKLSCTSSVLNVTGHKDEMICRYLAEVTAIKKNGVVCCSGGFHLDNISQDELKKIMEVIKEIGEEI